MRATFVAVQFTPRPGDRAFNVERAIEVAARAERYAPDLVVLPEVFTAAGAYDRYAELAEPVPGPTIKRLAELARRLRSNLVCGSIVERDGPRLFNTSVLLDRDGQVLARYRKLHLFSSYGSREASVFTPGEGLAVARTDIGVVGLSVCFDARFPEMFRALAAAGAEIVTSPSAWPYPRLEHWQLMHRSRAIENQYFYVAANWVGEVGTRRYLGTSMVLDPWGSIVAAAGEQEGLAVADVELDQVRHLREEFPLATLYRPEAYRLAGELSPVG